MIQQGFWLGVRQTWKMKGRYRFYHLSLPAFLNAYHKVPEMDAQAVANEIGARWFELSSVVEGKVEFLMQKILRDLLDRNMPEVDTHETNG